MTTPAPQDLAAISTVGQLRAAGHVAKTLREEIEKLRHRRPRTLEDVQLGLWSQPEDGSRRK